MARFELNVYGENDEIQKTYATDKARYGAFEEAIKFLEETEGKTEVERNLLAIPMLKKFIMKLFPTITEDEIRLCELSDIISLSYQVSKMASPMAEASGAHGESEKN